MQYYRNEKVFEGAIELEEKGQVDLEPTQHAGGQVKEEEKEKLSIILDRFNERFGTDFSHGDKIIQEVERHMSEREDIQLSAKNNTYENFKYGFKEAFETFVVDNIEEKEDYVKLLEKPEAFKMLDEEISWIVYNNIMKMQEELQ